MVWYSFPRAADWVARRGTGVSKGEVVSIESVSKEIDVSTFEWAIRARIPLIITTTDDPAHFVTVIKHLFQDRPVKRLSSADIPASDDEGVTGHNSKLKLQEGGIYWRLLTPPWAPNRSKADEWAFRHFADSGASMVIVNPHRTAELGPMWFDAGPVPVPFDKIHEVLSAFGLNSEKIEDVMPALGGLTIKDVAWLTALTQAKYHKLERGLLSEMRRANFPDRQGLSPVDTAMEFYEPEAELEEWLSLEAKFLMSKDDRLRPRGILLNGLPGTGKSMFAKRVAAVLGIPLYRLDMSRIKNKYVGMSEMHMRHMLMSVDREAPCVLLIDEVEKLFQTTESNDSGVSTGLLASLLWWAQEHKSPVVTVMTTNNINRIPQELYRPGRVDRVVDLPGIPPESVESFVKHCLDSYKRSHLAPDVMKSFIDVSSHVSQAVVSEKVRQAVKKDIIEKGG